MTRQKRAFVLSLTFAVGSALTFTALGVIATMAGSLIEASATWWYVFLGILMTLIGFYMFYLAF